MQVRAHPLFLNQLSLLNFFFFFKDFKTNFICSFNYGRAGSALLRGLFSSCGAQGLLPSWGAGGLLIAVGGFSCSGAVLSGPVSRKAEVRMLEPL